MFLPLLLITCLACIGCRQLDQPGHDRVRSERILRSVCKLVFLGQPRTEEPPPISLHSLVVWIKEHVSTDERFIDYEGKMIKDIWGNEIIILSQGDRFKGVGSAGPNGKWEGGQGDDLTVQLDDLIKELDEIE